jgi:hypothetical protein
LFLTPDEIVNFLPNDYHVLLGAGTLVTEDGAASDANLNYNSISVGQHIIARGVCPNGGTANSITIDTGASDTGGTCPSINGYPTLDATGASSTNTGSVRIQSTQAFGSLVSTATGSVTMNLTNLNQYPVSVYDFAGTGASPAVPADYVVNTSGVTLPTDLTAGGPLWVDGIVGPFGSAPPDFLALDVVDEASEPATLSIQYTASTLNQASAFATLTGTELSFNLGDSLLTSAQILIGAESIDLTTLPASPTVVAQVATAPPPITVATSNLTTSDLPPTFLPLYCVGNTANGISCYNTYATFQGELNTLFGAATPASVYAVTARGTYNRATNQFTAAAIDVILD